MKITIEHDDHREEVFEGVTDAYLAVRQLKPMGTFSLGHFLTESAGEFVTRSYSWGSNLRDLVKEIGQSLVELQTVLAARASSRRTDANSA